jgi:hypothetical protein
MIESGTVEMSTGDEPAKVVKLAGIICDVELALIGTVKASPNKFLRVGVYTETCTLSAFSNNVNDHVKLML